MGSSLSKYHSSRYVEGRKGETRAKGKECDSILSCRFDVLNVSGEDSAKKLWDKLGSLY
jgi:hypothetical protein